MSKKEKPKVAIDTNVLQKANAALEHTPRAGRRFALRVSLLQRFVNEELIALWSPQLHKEWQDKINEPRNDLSKIFFEIITNKNASLNYATPWGGSEQQRRKNCGYPHHDTHLLRTAYVKDKRTYLVTEENPILQTKKCIKREFDVVVGDIDDPI